MATNVLEVSDAELDTIFAALRFWQHFLETGRHPDPERMAGIIDIAANSGDMLKPNDIDKLCESLNS